MSLTAFDQFVLSNIMRSYWRSALACLTRPVAHGDDTRITARVTAIAESPVSMIWRPLGQRERQMSEIWVFVYMTGWIGQHIRRIQRASRKRWVRI